jgi:hypothetical protein
LIVPGFVDCHVHLPFVGWRADEFEARLTGVSYRELHGEGGIHRSARLFAEASDEDVLWSRPGQSHDRRPELYGELTEPQPDAFDYHYERRGLDTWPREYEKIRRS